MLKTRKMITFGALEKRVLFYDLETQKVFLTKYEYPPRKLFIWQGISLAVVLNIFLSYLGILELSNKYYHIFLYLFLVIAIHTFLIVVIRDEYLNTPIEEFLDWDTEEWKEVLIKERKSIITVIGLIIVSSYFAFFYFIEYLQDHYTKQLVFSLFFFFVVDVALFRSNIIKRYQVNKVLRKKQRRLTE